MKDNASEKEKIQGEIYYENENQKFPETREKSKKNVTYINIYCFQINIGLLCTYTLNPIIEKGVFFGEQLRHSNSINIYS